MDDQREDRRNAVLRALVEEHIRTGEPVSSRAVLDTTGLTASGATIRNELASLEREGYAVQPHTSAGRVPTAKAYRYYVDHISPGKPRSVVQTRVAAFYASMHMELGKLLKANHNTGEIFDGRVRDVEKRDSVVQISNALVEDAATCAK